MDDAPAPVQHGKPPQTRTMVALVQYIVCAKYLLLKAARALGAAAGRQSPGAVPSVQNHGAGCFSMF